MEYLTIALTWPSVFPVIQIAKTATESLIPAARIALQIIDLLRLSKLAFLMDLAQMGIIQMQIGSASLAIPIVKHANTLQLNVRSAKRNISSRDSVVLISACEDSMETIRLNLVTLIRLSQACSPWME